MPPQVYTIQLLHKRCTAQGETDIYHTATSQEMYSTRWGRHLPCSYFTRDVQRKVRQTFTIQLLHKRCITQGETDIYHAATSQEMYSARWGTHIPYSCFTWDVWDMMRQAHTIQLLHTSYMRHGEAGTYHAATSQDVYYVRWGRHRTATSHFKTPAKESLVLHKLKQYKPWFGEEYLGFFDKVNKLKCSGYRIQVRAV